MMNALPSNLNVLVHTIEKTINDWPVKISLEHAIKWVLQFEVEHYALAVRILENLDILDSSSIRSSLEVAQTKLIRKISEKGSPMKGNNTLFAAIGNTAKSGALIAYHYRATTGISEDDFVSSDEEEQLDLSKIDNIVLVDDVIGSGKTIAKEVKRVAEEVYSLSKTRNIFVLTVAGYDDGIKHITKETGATVVTALEYNTRDTVANLDAAFYKGMPVAERNAALETIKKYCRLISSSNLGYSELGGLLIFDHNTPNTTLPIIWSNSKGWLPLFPRTKKMPGVAKLLKSAEEERRVTSPSNQLTLFVEGKLDEIFIDCFLKTKNLLQELQVPDIKAIALGGLNQSERLLELITESKKQAIFIVDNDLYSQRALERIDYIKESHVLKLNPTFAAMLDIDKIYENKERFPKLPEKIPNIDDEKWWSEFEHAILKRGPISTNYNRIDQIIEEFLDQEKYGVFCENLKLKIQEMLNFK
ncbi:hypothetical protein [Erwinia sp. S38]|uniref:phosphoribosyltransferase-like protein n=1 Tax=Erwinia sp. S38 TaxID=2769338 RepID=UPI00190B80CA|nr:hypothetical protein [Erwinia sp. S38]MBK0004639.1 hypothetical protein [Erwinia sp. S38]